MQFVVFRGIFSQKCDSVIRNLDPVSVKSPELRIIVLSLP